MDLQLIFDLVDDYIEDEQLDTMDYYGITMSEAELIDKFSILSLKWHNLIYSRDKIRNEITKVFSTVMALYNVAVKTKRAQEFKELALKLMHINTTLWELEDMLRNEISKLDYDCKTVTDIAIHIQDANIERAQTKNAISKLFNNLSSIEIKKYGEKSVS